MSIGVVQEPDGKYTVYMDECDYLLGVNAHKKVTLKDLIDLEGKIHYLVLKHEMGDKFDTPKEHVPRTD